MNLIEVLNTIRDNATTEYQNRIPQATRDNLDTIGAIMIDDDNIMVANEFMQTLLNKLVKSVVHTKMFTNPLKTLKAGTKPLGDTVEEIYVNFLKGEKHDQTGDVSKLMGRTLPDVKTVYHRMNYKLQYPVTVTREDLTRAFKSYDALESFINSIINQLYNSAELDEYKNTIEIIKRALKQKAMVTIDIADPLESEKNGKDFIKAVKTVSGKMAFPSTMWNGYLTAQDTDTKPITTLSRKSEQVLILDTDTDVSVSVDVLASLFNMTVAEFNDTRKIVIDNFPSMDDGSIVRACLVDERFFQIYDDLFNITSFYNGQSLYTNYFLNIWQTQAYSILVNAVAFVVPAE